MKYFITFTLLVFFLDLVPNTNGQNNRPALSKEQMEKARIYLKELSSNQRNWVDPSDGGFFKMMPEEDPQDMVQIRDEKGQPTDEHNQPANFVEEEISVQLSEKHSGFVQEENFVQLSEKHSGTVDSLPDSELVSIVNDQDLDNVLVESGASKHCTENKDCFFLARWLKRLKNEVDKISEMNVSGRKIVSFPLSEAQISTLKAILQNANHNLVDVEGVIKDILSQLEVSNEEGISLSHLQSSFFNNTKIMYACVVAGVLAVLVYIFHFCKHPGICVCFIVVVATVCAQWKLLYDHAVAEKMARLEEIDYPAACKKGDLGFIESVQFYFKSWFVSSGNCAAYYKAQMVDPFWEVSIMEAISLSVSRFLFAPLEALAHVLNKAIKILLLDLSLFQTCILLVMIILVLLMYFNYKVRFPWFFATIEPAPLHHVSQPLPSVSTNSDDNQHRAERYITVRETKRLKCNPAAGKTQSDLSVDSCCGHCTPESCQRESLTSTVVAEAIDFKPKRESGKKRSSVTAKSEEMFDSNKKCSCSDKTPDVKEISRDDEIFVMKVREILRNDSMCDSKKTLESDEVFDVKDIVHDKEKILDALSLKNCDEMVDVKDIVHDDDKENIPGALPLENRDVESHGDSELKKAEKLVINDMGGEKAKFNEHGDST